MQLVVSTPTPPVEPFTNELVPLPSGARLEADLLFPLSENDAANANVPRKLAVCLHPWSWLGGRKDDPTLSCLSRILLSAGYYVVRYNSRGVGNSSGWPSFTGSSEAQDLRDLVQWLMGRIANVRDVVIAGYSYGSLIASLYPLLPPLVKIHHLFLSYPLSPRGWLTAFRTDTYATALSTLMKDPNADILIIYGTRDEFTSVSKYDAWASEMARGGVAAALRIERVEGATHFWFNHQQELERIVRSWPLVPPS